MILSKFMFFFSLFFNELLVLSILFSEIKKDWSNSVYVNSRQFTEMVKLIFFKELYFNSPNFTRFYRKIINYKALYIS